MKLLVARLESHDSYFLEEYRDIYENHGFVFYIDSLYEENGNGID